jgi:hypothetical protein
MTDTRDHWENIYLTRTAVQLSWYQEHPFRSLRFIQRSGVARPLKSSMSGGTSTLAKQLLASFRTLAVWISLQLLCRRTGSSWEKH